MKNIAVSIFLILTLLVVANACTKTAAKKPALNKGALSDATYMETIKPTFAPLTAPISVEQANRMILSYLNGIDYTINTNETRSFTCDADELRSYLSNTHIKKFKFLLAHNMAYINGGGEGKRPQPNDNALTFIIVGVDSDNNYVLMDDGDVLDKANPCPDQCIPTGTASNNLIVLQ